MSRVQSQLLEIETNKKLLCRKGICLLLSQLLATTTSQVLESIKRRCRYELFGCDFEFHESSVMDWKTSLEKIQGDKPRVASN